MRAQLYTSWVRRKTRDFETHTLHTGPRQMCAARDYFCSIFSAGAKKEWPPQMTTFAEGTRADKCVMTQIPLLPFFRAKVSDCAASSGQKKEIP